MIEMLFSITILINIFVLLTQMFYNINNLNTHYFNENILVYETVVMRMEVALKEVSADDLIIQDNSIQYTVNEKNYRYYLSGTNLLYLDQNNVRYLYLPQIKSIRFEKENNLILIEIIDLYDQSYETKIIFNN